ncbi:hypothetical protein [Deinococcus aquaedulcis]|uniref:hypothetical protein n=1 Tax=Deinococcus aquaedulcis TaxID=2840455 RepID=UPI001C83C3A3|nr:hypothetical protein [Deinococcus aquaedulcis]
MTHTPQCLTDYLAAVTAPFPADTAARLRGELQAHVLEAAEALADQGDPTPTETALRDLGSVREGRRALERQHYTGAEEEVLLACRFAHLKRTSAFSLALGAAIILAWPLLLLWLERPITWGLYGALGAVVLASAILERWVPRRFPACSARVLLGLLRLCMVPAVIGAFQVLALNGEATRWAGLLGAGVGFWLVARHDWRTLWSLLPKALSGAR